MTTPKPIDPVPLRLFDLPPAKVRAGWPEAKRAEVGRFMIEQMCTHPRCGTVRAVAEAFGVSVVTAKAYMDIAREEIRERTGDLDDLRREVARRRLEMIFFACMSKAKVADAGSGDVSALAEARRTVESMVKLDGLQAATELEIRLAAAVVGEFGKSVGLLVARFVPEESQGRVLAEVQKLIAGAMRDAPDVVDEERESARVDLALPAGGDAPPAV